MNASWPDRIDRALEGLLSEEEEAALQLEVTADPAVRAAYVEAAWLHATLRAQRETLPDLLRAEAPVAPGKPLVRRWPVIAWAAALAACVAVAAGAAWQRRPIATLVQAENCKWAGSDLPTSEKARLGSGTLALVEGMATLRFRNGATVTLEAPTKFQILSAMHCRLIEGSVVAEVPDAAHGFTIDSPDLKVVDLGTKFGLAASASGHSQVQVFKGEVEVGGLAGGQRRRLLEGKGMTAGTNNPAPGSEPSHGQPVQETGGWLSIPTSFGRGKDGYARRDRSSGAATQPLIMVKHSDLPTSYRNERRAVLTFDLSQAASAQVTEAELVLQPVPSGFGFSALVPDSHFAVYGLTDEALDGWDEHALAWANLPGCSDEGPLPEKTRRLAEFSIPRGGEAGPLIIRGEALAQFIREDHNGLASFLIVRETGETDPSGLVHAFASKEHPTARPPTLRLK